MSKLKEIIKKYYIFEYLISNLHCLESWIIPLIISDKVAVKRYYKNIAGKELNLERPTGFTEKLNWYKLNVQIPLMQTCADKVAVRDYVTAKGFKENLNDVYAICKTVKELDIDSYPDCFVIKASHGSHMNLIIKNKESINWFKEKLMMSTWLRQNIYWGGREWVYKDIPRRLVVEKYLEDESGELQDYKFFCFNGQPKFMQLERGRFGKEHIRNFYDMEWKLLPFGKGMPPNTKIQVPIPLQFERMKQIASVLAEPFQFVRVDLYQANSKIYFGELTFFPAGGMPNFCPPEYDQIVGEYWNLID